MVVWFINYLTFSYRETSKRHYILITVLCLSGRRRRRLTGRRKFTSGFFSGFLSYSVISPLSDRRITRTSVWKLKWPNTVCARFTDSVSDAIKDGAYYCYCAYVLRISRYLGFLWVVPTNTGIFLRTLKLCGESRT